MYRILFLILGFLLSGCVYPQLEADVLRLSETAENIERKQILLALAKFIDDPDAIPFMVNLGTGQAQVQNAVATTWQLNRVLSATQNAATFGPPATAQLQGNWSVTAVNDIEDLMRLRCLFSFAVRRASGEVGIHVSYANYARGCKPQGIAVEVSPRIPPPEVPFFGYSRPGQPGTPLTCEGDTLVQLGNFRGIELYGCRRAFHNFTLSVLSGAELSCAGLTRLKTGGAGTKRRDIIVPKAQGPTIFSPIIPSQ